MRRCLSGRSPKDGTRKSHMSDLMSPVTGTVCEINEELLDAPEALNNDPYGAWIIKVDNITGTEELLDPASYEEHCAAEA